MDGAVRNDAGTYVVSSRQEFCVETRHEWACLSNNFDLSDASLLVSVITDSYLAFANGALTLNTRYHFRLTVYAETKLCTDMGLVGARKQDVAGNNNKFISSSDIEFVTNSPPSKKNAERERRGEVGILE